MANVNMPLYESTLKLLLLCDIILKRDVNIQV